METLLWGIFGAVVIYTWVHAAVVFNKEKEKRTRYEKVVSLFALITITLYVVGTM